MVNDTVISKQDIAYFKAAKNNPQVEDSQLVEEMVATELLKQEAVAHGIAERDDVKYQLQLQESELLARLLMREKFSNVSFSDEEIQAQYDAQFGGDAGREYKARHILVKTEDEAKAVIEALRNGGDFIALAQERSTGPSGPNGGDLGWFQSTTMVAPFADAVKAMNKGDISVSPVQTQFGWHIIKLEDTRDAAKPDLESVRTQIEQSLIRDAINVYIQEIRSNAAIDIK
jgi:peptidyl-prolyl cis-trans isomerase C